MGIRRTRAIWGYVNYTFGSVLLIGDNSRVLPQEGAVVHICSSLYIVGLPWFCFATKPFLGGRPTPSTTSSILPLSNL